MKKLLGIVVFCGSVIIVSTEEQQLFRHVKTPPIQVPQREGNESSIEDEIAAGSLALLEQKQRESFFRAHRELMRSKNSELSEKEPGGWQDFIRFCERNLFKP